MSYVVIAPEDSFSMKILKTNPSVLKMKLLRMKNEDMIERNAEGRKTELLLKLTGNFLNGEENFCDGDYVQ